MKLLFYISTIRGGGAGRVMVNLANQFFGDGTDVIFVTNFKSDTEYLLSPSIHRIIIEESECKEGFLKKNVNRISKLRRIFKQEKPDIVISFLKENDYRAFVASRGLPYKLLLSVRNDPNKLYCGFVNKVLANYIYGHADAVVFQTSDAQNWFKKLRGKYQVIFNQVDPRFYAVERSANNKPAIVTVGKFMKQKNHKLLMEAFISIADQIEANLIIYGDGPLREEYEALITSNNMEGRIFLPGEIDDVPKVLADAKLFVLTSDYEGMPNALMEAMAAGVPCISTDCPCGGPKEILPESLLVPVGDKHALSEMILKLMNDDEALHRLGSNCKKASERFKPEVVFGQWRNFIGEQIVS